MLQNASTMPEGYSVYGHQVAGHRFEAGKQGMLLDEDGRILKPIQAPPRGEREVGFYQTVFGYETSDQTVLKLRQFVPMFYGVKHVAFPDLSFKEDNYIILEDLTRNFNKPCILDVKIGRCVTDHLASKAKRERAEIKYPEQEQFGFRILGMKVYDKSCKYFKSHDKTFGKNLKTCEEVLAGLKEFFHQEHGKDHIKQILEHLKMIKMWAQEQQIFRLYSSSILIIYEGNEIRNANTNCVEKENSESDFHASNNAAKDTELTRKLCTVTLSKKESSNCVNPIDHSGKWADRNNYGVEMDTENQVPVPKFSIHLIDFAHTYIGHYNEPDDNYLYGLCNLIHYFEQMVTR